MYSSITALWLLSLDTYADGFMQDIPSYSNSYLQRQSLYQRYAQITVEFTTNDPDPIIDAFMATCRHGMSVFECYGAYSHRKYYVCKAVISTYELRDVVDNVRKVDPKVLINTYNTVNFYGNFYQKPLE